MFSKFHPAAMIRRLQTTEFDFLLLQFFAVQESLKAEFQKRYRGVDTPRRLLAIQTKISTRFAQRMHPAELQKVMKGRHINKKVSRLTFLRAARIVGD